MRYVCGFAFNQSKDKVALILKNRPPFLEGKYNAIGGKVEDTDESEWDTMSREFEEEAGVSIQPHEWEVIGSLDWSTVEDLRVSFFYVTLDDQRFSQIKTTTDEEVRVFSIFDINMIKMDDAAKMFLQAALLPDVFTLNLTMK